MAKKEVVETYEENVRPSGIVVNDPETFRPTVLPLIVVLPKDASKAQIERAKVLNGYAYQFPKKWAVEKEQHLKDLEALKDAPDPQEDENMRLSVGTTPKLAE